MVSVQGNAQAQYFQQVPAQPQSQQSQVQGHVQPQQHFQQPQQPHQEVAPEPTQPVTETAATAESGAGEPAAFQ